MCKPDFCGVQAKFGELLGLVVGMAQSRAAEPHVPAQLPQTVSPGTVRQRVGGCRGRGFSSS